MLAMLVKLVVMLAGTVHIHVFVAEHCHAVLAGLAELLIGVLVPFLPPPGSFALRLALVILEEHLEYLVLAVQRHLLSAAHSFWQFSLRHHFLGVIATTCICKAGEMEQS